MKYANLYSHTDIHPHEITRTISPKCLEIRPMLSERDLSIDLRIRGRWLFWALCQPEPPAMGYFQQSGGQSVPHSARV